MALMNNSRPGAGPRATRPGGAGADFPPAEFEARAERASAVMAAAGLDALLFTTEAEIRYFTGFRIAFWRSSTRPWFLVLPKRKRPVAVIPEVGAALMTASWVGEVRTWPAPRPERRRRDPAPSGARAL